MSTPVTLLLGTNKGAFIATSPDGADWSLSGPHCEAWPINHVIGTGDTVWACGGTDWQGVGVWRRTGSGWTWSGTGIEAGDGQDKINTVFSLGRGADGALYTGTRPAALFVSRDEGQTWTHLPALTCHETRDGWMPGGAGLILHTIVTHPTDPAKLWVGISAAGVFATEDGGTTWEPRNTGVRMDFAPEDQQDAPVGHCVHNAARAPGEADLLYQQNHCGMYRSLDGGRSWQSMENGLPSTFGFPVAVHPREAGTVWLMPMNGDSTGRYPPGGTARVWKSTDGGSSWRGMGAGLPEKDAYFTVLRQAMAVDTGDPAGVYFGTSSGSLFASRDEGESWNEIFRHLPVILSVETLG